MSSKPTPRTHKPFSDGRPREMLWITYSRGMHVLIPKSRGDGYLRVPVGHNSSPLSSISYDVGYDFFGLDGMLTVETSYIPLDQREAFAASILEPVSALLGFPYREATAEEFWRLHPVKTEPPEGDEPALGMSR